jgi:hypothetical protein
MLSAEGAESVITDMTKVIVYRIPTLFIEGEPAAETVLTEGDISGELIVSIMPLINTEVYYQWYINTVPDNINGRPIANETSSRLIFPETLNAAGSPYYYYCVISAAGYKDGVSRVATVYVNPQNNNQNIIHVSFYGLKDVTVQYYTNVSGWVTVGAYDDITRFIIPDEHTATWGTTTVQLIKGGMYYTFNGLVTNQGNLFLDAPVYPITIKNILDKECGIAITQYDWVYHYTPACVDDDNVFLVFGNGVDYNVSIYRPGFYPITLNNIIAGSDIYFGAECFYSTQIPDGVTDVWISSYDWAVRGANEGDIITLLCDFYGEIRTANLRYTYMGETYNEVFKLDGTDLPFPRFYE